MFDFIQKHWIGLLVVGTIIWWLGGFAEIIVNFYDWIAVNVSAVALVAEYFAINNFLGTLVLVFVVFVYLEVLGALLYKEDKKCLNL